MLWKKTLIYVICRIPGFRSMKELRIIREADFSIFLKYQGSFYFLILEVKCNKEHNKGTRGTKKHATKQLEDIEQILQLKLKENLVNVQSFVIWPNLLSVEPPCIVCNEQHGTFSIRPSKCRLPGATTDPKVDTDGKHIFKEDLENHAFNTWMHSIVSCPSKSMEKLHFDKLLSIYASLACGALFDKVMILIKRFFVLFVLKQVFWGVKGSLGATSKK